MDELCSDVLFTIFEFSLPEDVFSLKQVSRKTRNIFLNLAFCVTHTTHKKEGITYKIKNVIPIYIYNFGEKDIACIYTIYGSSNKGHITCFIINNAELIKSIVFTPNNYKYKKMLEIIKMKHKLLGY